MPALPAARPAARAIGRRRFLAICTRPPDGDYTLVHAGRQVRIGPVAFWIVVGTLVVMAHLVDRDRNLFRFPR